MRALYGALTLSLIVLGGCDQPTDPDKKDTEEDKWETLLMPNGTAREWREFTAGDSPVYDQTGSYTFFPNRTVGISNNFHGNPVFYNSTYENGTFDGTTAIFDNGTNKLTIKFRPAPSPRRQEITIYNPRYENYDSVVHFNRSAYYSLLD